MKHFILSVAVSILAGCQSTGDESQSVGASIEIVSSQYRFMGPGPQTMAPKNGQQFAAIQKAFAALQWDSVKFLSLKHLNSYPGNSNAFIFLSLAHTALNETGRARFYAELVLKSEPSNAYALNILGVLKYREALLPEDYRRALIYFQLARQAAPQSPTPVLNAATLNLEVGNFSEARGDFKQAREKCFDCQSALIGSALAAQSLGFFDEAKDVIKIILNKDDKNEVARLLQAGQLYYVDQKHEESHVLLTELLNNAKGEGQVQKEARNLMNRIEAVSH